MCLSLICRRRRAYIPPPVHFTEDSFRQNINSVDITSGFKEVSLPFCHRSTSTILISRRHRAWRIRQLSAQREGRSSADGLLCSICAMCHQRNHRFIDDGRDLPIRISSMEIQSNIKAGFTTTSIGTNSQNL